MGVLIKGMKMPRSCEYCRFSGVGGLRNERVVCMFTGANAYMNTVQYLDDCPLVEIPTSHGRLIDADALLGLLDKCMFPSDMVTTTAVGMATNWIKEAPTVIEAEDGDGNV